MTKGGAGGALRETEARGQQTLEQGREPRVCVFLALIHEITFLSFDNPCCFPNYHKPGGFKPKELVLYCSGSWRPKVKVWAGQGRIPDSWARGHRARFPASLCVLLCLSQGCRGI